MSTTEAFFADPRVKEQVDPGILAQLRAVQPEPGKDADYEIGHWIAQTAACLGQIRSLAQKVKELEADA
ncbi:hypothetical protein RI444_07635 [Paenarthrobacter sp. AT5]|uniref:hypothetical protein n=1 Tax=Paenarthrobacter TaxID=1742992 RepID=UPI001A999390|nr:MULTISPECIES: hypothetical protein [Paenarthrobacter]QSZ54498.1 hypothetical protein AYX19_16930 [Paenarthrobacter ureafaciens]WOC62482.1 hypothetical protein RI444_07635 [Paenarthrobacter sp. AT5]